MAVAYPLPALFLPVAVNLNTLFPDAGDVTQVHL
jgi:hypothetical protein